MNYKLVRIIRIWYKGKLPYAKRYRRWMRGQLFRDLVRLIPDYLVKLQERYSMSSQEFEETMNNAQLSYFDSIINQPQPKTL